MLRSRANIGMLLSLALVCVLGESLCFAQALATAPTPAKASTAAKSRTTKKKVATPTGEVPETPPPPPTLEQQPPAAPQVTYRNGELTINSQNATLSQVLRSVQAQTGASVDLPAGAGSERVVATLGPGKPKDVLASLLNGSKFNYVILGESNNPGAVQKVILMAKTVVPTGGGNPVPVVVNPSGPPTPQAIEPPEDEYTPPEPEPDQNQLVPGQPGLAGGDQVTPDVVNPAGRTPEQMLQELQRIQQQQQQMQQQLNPANQGQPQAFPGQPLSPQPR